MRKPVMSLVMILFTVLYLLLTVAWTDKGETAVKARIVTVQRADVHQVAAIAGRLAYADEQFIYAPATCRIKSIHVKRDQRVGKGEAMIRLELGQDDLITQYAKGVSLLQENGTSLPSFLAMDNSVIRAENPCTVRQVFVEEQGITSVGMPLLRVSSNRQTISCLASELDAKKIRTGMWAWLSVDGEAYGFAKVDSVGEPEAEPQTGLLISSISLIPEQHIDLPEGASINADVYLAGSDDVLSLPIEAITTRNTVWWVSDGRCTEIPAEIVMSDELRAWVKLPEGLPVAIGEFVNGQKVAEAKE